MKIGWIGTGNMGLRMAKRLIMAGNELCVYNRTESKTRSLIDTGRAFLKSSSSEIFEECDIVFSSITNDEVWKEMLGKYDIGKVVRPGAVIVEMSTLSPEYSAELREEFHKAECLYIDAPVIGSMFMVEQGLLKVIASGDKAAFDIAFPYLMAIGRSAEYLGTGAQARYMKIAVNMLICSYMTIYGELLLSGESMGSAWEELNNILECSDGACPMLTDKGTLHRQRIWGSPAALTSTALKDLGLALSCGYKTGCDLSVTAIICQYDRFMHFNPKYESFSSFGTIGMLEEICGISPIEGSPGIPEDKKTDLQNTLVVVTTILAREALAFCGSVGINRDMAEKLLVNCHGATSYFKKLYAGEETKLTMDEAKKSIQSVMDDVCPKGIFIPIIAESAQRLNVISRDMQSEDLLSKILF